MTFAAYARFAVPRNANLCSWSRNLAMNMKASRGLASSPLLRFAAEQRPLSGFAEQAVKGACIGPAGSLGDASIATGSVTAELVASLLNSLAEQEDTIVGNSFSEMRDVHAQGSGRK